MRIYSMKATFGKLEHETLTLKPGLNVIEAPNEWGKSTWCAFLIAMLYGIDTRAKSSRSQLADKDRFLPWSGAPMEGSMDLNWNGRDITIQRTTKGRIPMGEFRAFETASGLNVPELTAENCGLMLLGIEKEVFTRSGFLRFSDLPVTEDEQLRRRLNALVTTGDESDNVQRLEQKLKELKHRCRYNRTGLIPQANEEKERLDRRLEEYRTLNDQIVALQEQILRTEQRIKQLENHKISIHYKTWEQQAEKIQEAHAAADEAQRYLEELRDQAEIVPDRDTAIKNIRRLSQLQEELESIQMEEQMLPGTPSIPEPPQGFAGCTAKEAIIQAEQHRRELQSLRVRKRPTATILLIIGSVLLFLAFMLFFNGEIVYSLIGAGVGLVLLGIAFVLMHITKLRINRYHAKHFKLSKRYGCTDPGQWVEDAYAYAQAWESYTHNEESSSALRSELLQRKEVLMAQSMTASRSKGLSNALDYWNDIVNLWDEYADARCALRQARKHAETLSSLASHTPAPEMEDTLTFTEDETLRLISDANQDLKQLLSKRGQLVGQLEALGSQEALLQEYDQITQRIEKLEQTYAALDFAQKSLEQARTQLQRRFSPRIVRAAQDILSRLTQGRYTKIALAEDLSVQVQASGEDVLRSRHYRSDGTVDQLYLALRLAVAKELTPQAPLILDDAMVRFDNQRLRLALEILDQEAQHKQVILFTCQNREQRLLERT